MHLTTLQGRKLEYHRLRVSFFGSLHRAMTAYKDGSHILWARRIGNAWGIGQSLIASGACCQCFAQLDMCGYVTNNVGYDEILN